MSNKMETLLDLFNFELKYFEDDEISISDTYSFKPKSFINTLIQYL